MSLVLKSYFTLSLFLPIQVCECVCVCVCVCVCAHVITMLSHKDVGLVSPVFVEQLINSKNKTKKTLKFNLS